MDADHALGRVQRCLGLLGCGALLALVAAVGRDREQVRARAGALAVWVCDRDAQRVVGLDSDLFQALSVEIAWPIELEPRGDGGCWVVSAVDGWPLGAHRLVRLAATGEVLSETLLGAAGDLATLGGEDALLVELGSGADGSDRLMRVGADGTAAVLFERAGLRAVGGAGEEILLGTAAGEALLLAVSAVGVVSARAARLGGEIGDVAPGPRAGTWWALDVGGEGRLHLLAADLSPAWSAPIGFKALHVAPVPGEERVWLAGANEPRVLRLGPRGVPEVERRDLPLGGLERGAGLACGGALLVAPGALLRLAADGRSAPGQGGFAFLADVAAL